MERDAELVLGIPTEVLLDEGRSETVKTGGHRRVGGKEVARSRDGQCDFEGLPGLFHEGSSPFQHGEGGMPFIQVADFGLDAERIEQAPSADPEDQFLLEAQLRPASVKLAGNPSMSREVRRVIAVQQVQLHSADLDLPGTQPDRVTGQVESPAAATPRSVSRSGVIGNCPGSLYGKRACCAPSLSITWRK